MLDDLAHHSSLAHIIGTWHSLAPIDLNAQAPAPQAAPAPLQCTAEYTHTLTHAWSHVIPAYAHPYYSAWLQSSHNEGMRPHASDPHLQPTHLSGCKSIKIQKLLTVTQMERQRDVLKGTLQVTLPNVHPPGAPRTHDTVTCDGVTLDKRAAMLQFDTVEQSTKAGLMSIATAVYNARPCLPHHLLPNGAFASFMRRHLRTGYDPSNAYVTHCLKCKAVNGVHFAMENTEAHSHNCSAAAYTRVHRHNVQAKLLCDELRSCCDNIVYEPRPHPGTAAARRGRARPDLKFQSKVAMQTTPDSSSSRTQEARFEDTPLCAFTAIDVTYASLAQKDLLHRQPYSYGDDVYWKSHRRKKQKEHGDGCLPFVITTLGAIDPESIAWLDRVFRDHLTDKHKEARTVAQRIRSIIQSVALSTTKYNYQMYRTVAHFMRTQQPSTNFTFVGL